MKTLQQQRLDFLNETVAYYSEDTTRRAVDYDGYCEYYQFSTGNKCAIGRHIQTEDLINKNLEGKVVDEKVVLDVLPDEIKNLGIEFLSAIQGLHDNESNWATNSLSDRGKVVVESIIDIYCI